MGVRRTISELLEMRPYGGYRVVLADPPWRQEMRSEKGEGKSPQSKYECMTLQEIASLPVCEISSNNSVLFMWTTSPNHAQGMSIMREWGFEYKAFVPWAKESKNSGHIDTEDPNHKWAFGTGYIFRSAAELLIVGTRGCPAWYKTIGARSIRNLIYAPVREHSRKPVEQYQIIETLIPGPYLEMFARSCRDGWDVFGNQTEKFSAS